MLCEKPLRYDVATMSLTMKTCLPVRDYHAPSENVTMCSLSMTQPPQHKTSLTFIFGLAVVIITLTAVAALYAMDPARNVVSAATTTLDPSNITGINVTGKALVDD
ncbi:hypothetical protein MRX96_014738 [Rhipicephalus microplus]